MKQIAPPADIIRRETRLEESYSSSSPTMRPGFAYTERVLMAHEVLPLRRVDHVRFFVGNARQSAYFYHNAFGFDVVAYAGLETGMRHEAGYVLKQGDITFVLASPLGPDHPDNARLA